MNHGLLTESAVLYCRSKFSDVTDDNSLVTAASAFVCRTNGLWEKVKVAVDQVPAKYSKGIPMPRGPTLEAAARGKKKRA